MANEEEKRNDDLYAVLGLNKECTTMELRTAYKKLAMRWHPDRFSASRNSEFVEEAKKKFQAIQQAYSVLSDANRRFLYDVGAFESDDDENGMGDFLNEMAAMMCQSKPSENTEESFEQLQELFHEMFKEDVGAFGSSCRPSNSCSTSSLHASFSVCFDQNNKSNSLDVSSEKMKVNNDSFGFEARAHNFSLGVEHQQDFKKGKGAKGGGRGGASGSRRLGVKQKVSSSAHDVSSKGYGISTS